MGALVWGVFFVLIIATVVPKIQILFSNSQPAQSTHLIPKLLIHDVNGFLTPETKDNLVVQFDHTVLKLPENFACNKDLNIGRMHCSLKHQTVMEYLPVIERKELGTPLQALKYRHLSDFGDIRNCEIIITFSVQDKLFHLTVGNHLQTLLPFGLIPTLRYELKPVLESGDVDQASLKLLKILSQRILNPKWLNRSHYLILVCILVFLIKYYSTNISDGVL
jgi:hypothetical protein